MVNVIHTVVLRCCAALLRSRTTHASSSGGLFRMKREHRSSRSSLLGSAMAMALCGVVNATAALSGTLLVPLSTGCRVEQVYRTCGIATQASFFSTPLC